MWHRLLARKTKPTSCNGTCIPATVFLLSVLLFFFTPLNCLNTNFSIFLSSVSVFSPHLFSPFFLPTDFLCLLLLFLVLLLGKRFFFVFLIFYVSSVFCVSPSFNSPFFLCSHRLVFLPSLPIFVVPLCDVLLLLSKFFILFMSCLLGTSTFFFSFRPSFLIPTC